AARLRECDAPLADWEKSSTARVIPPARPRKLAKVPFVELADGRLQGVVSSGSDIERVYVSSVEAGTYAFACSTNHNRPCGGARGMVRNHIRALTDEAVLRYGAERVARYLRVEDTEPNAQSITVGMSSTRPPHADTRAAAPVFSRFLRHLAYLEFAPVTAPVPEMHWFPPTRAVASCAPTCSPTLLPGSTKPSWPPTPSTGRSSAACYGPSPPRPPAWRSSPAPSPGRR